MAIKLPTEHNLGCLRLKGGCTCTSEYTCQNATLLEITCRGSIIQVHFRLDFFMEANNMNPDQTAPKEQSDQGPC